MASHSMVPRAARVLPALAGAALVTTFAATAAADPPAPATTPARVAILVPSGEAPPPRARGKQANVGLQLGIRTGYAVGAGAVYSGFDLNDGSHGAVPIIVDAGYRVLPQLYLGLYGQFAYVVPRTNNTSCPNNFDCAVQDWRFGIQADYHFLPRLSFDPYVGFGVGYEVLHNSISGSSPVPMPGGVASGNVDVSATDRGWEFGSLSLGADFRLTPEVGLGPFISGTLGAYNVHTGDQTVTVGGTQVANKSLPDVEHAWHELFIGGLRGTFNP